MNMSEPWPTFPLDLRNALENRLPEYLPRQRWFGGKARQIRHVHVAELLPLPRLDQIAPEPSESRRSPESATIGLSKPLACWLAIVVVDYADSGREGYTLPLTVCPAELDNDSRYRILRWTSPNQCGWDILEATYWEPFWWALICLLAGHSRPTASAPPSEPGFVVHTSAFSPTPLGRFDPQDIRIFPGEQSQSLAVFRDRFVVKLFRRLEEGISPDWEITCFLTEQRRFPHVPAALAAWFYMRPDASKAIAENAIPSTFEAAVLLAMMTTFQANRGNAWQCMLDELQSYRRISLPDEVIADSQTAPSNLSCANLLALAQETPPPPWGQIFASHLARTALLGQRTAELHLALAESSQPTFCPEPWTPADQEALIADCLHQLQSSFSLLRSKLTQLAPDVRALAEAVLDKEGEWLLLLATLHRSPCDGVKIRIHGDYHLGQVLCTEDDFILLDFEGEPARPLAERRRKQSPLRDVAGMLRSFHYAASAALLAASRDCPERQKVSLRLLFQKWYLWSAAAFMRGYLQTPHIRQLLPTSADNLARLLSAFLTQKAAYELAYELNHRPDWVEIPLRGLSDLVASEANRWAKSG
ncbi:MAG: hypothetical protein RMI91_05650 [Gemmatales bacterium]|nr:hypothetical protein [Gemmatales bacterium]MDW7994119.1 hypothetical protein [Gemmatales bacterium]